MNVHFRYYVAITLAGRLVTKHWALIYKLDADI